MAVATQATLRDRRETDVIASPSAVHRAWITTLDELEAIPSNVTVLNVKILWRQLGDVHGFTERTERMWLAANPLTGASGGVSASRCAWVRREGSRPLLVLLTSRAVGMVVPILPAWPRPRRGWPAAGQPTGQVDTAST